MGFRRLSQKTLSAGVIATSCACFLLNGCGDSGGGGAVRSGRTAFLSMGTAPVGGAFPLVGGAICEVLNNHKGENNWKFQPKGTKGSQQNIRQLAQGQLQLALSNAAITYFAVRCEAGWERAYEMRAMATLAPNVAMFITREDSGINSIPDLKGRRVVIGPAGAGFEMFVQPLLAAHDVSYGDFTPLNATQSGAVGLLGDGSADAAFLGGAIPTGSITQACSTHDIRFIPFGERERQQLVNDYDFFQRFTVPKDKYSDLTEDFQGMNVGSMHLITSADQDEDLIYQITKTIWEHRDEIATKHPAGKAINENNVARYTGTEFHPGAIRFYREAGLWPDSDPAAVTAPTDSGASAEATADATIEEVGG